MMHAVAPRAAFVAPAAPRGACAPRLRVGAVSPRRNLSCSSSFALGGSLDDGAAQASWLVGQAFAAGVAVAGWWAFESAARSREKERQGEPCPVCQGSGEQDCACVRWSRDGEGCGTCQGRGRAVCRGCGGGGQGRRIPLILRAEPGTGAWPRRVALLWRLGTAAAARREGQQPRAQVFISGDLGARHRRTAWPCAFGTARPWPTRSARLAFSSLFWAGRNPDRLQPRQAAATQRLTRRSRTARPTPPPPL